MDRGEPAPLTVEILFGDGCNQNCKFCAIYNGEERPAGKYNLPGLMTETDYLRLIDECGEMGVKRIQMSGDGEPLYNKPLAMKLMKKVKEYGMYGFLNTNGVLLNDEDAKKLVQWGWDKFLFSIEGPDAQTHDYLVTFPGAFKKVMANIRNLQKYKQELGTDVPEIEMKMVLTNRNYNKVREMVILAQELGVHLRIDSLIIFNDFGKQLMLNEIQRKEFKVHIKEAIEISKNSMLRFNVSDELLEDVYSKAQGQEDVKEVQVKQMKDNKFLSAPCYTPWVRVLVSSQGQVGPCGFCYVNENVKTKSLKEIWNGESFVRLRRDRLNQKLDKYCSMCGDIEYNSIIRRMLNESTDQNIEE